MESLVGRVLNKKYQIVKLIGRGGMGAVYEAVHCDLDKKVAVKTLLPSLAENEEVYQRFLLEARAASRLRHPHIIEVTDFDHTSDGMPFMVLEHLEGEDLSQALARQGRLAPEQVRTIFRDVLSAMEAAHQAGIVHRDLKPNNIFLCRYGDRHDFPKVLDFGISKVLDATGGLTASTAYVGTPNYMAPEQADGRSGEVDARSDVFALGSILYRTLSGRDAFPGDRVATVLYKIVNEDPPPLSERSPGLPEATVEVVRRAMARNPDDRFPSVAALAQALLPSLGPGHGEPDAKDTDRCAPPGGMGDTAVATKIAQTDPGPAREPVAAAEDISLASTMGRSVGELMPELRPEAPPQPQPASRKVVPLLATVAGLLVCGGLIFWFAMAPGPADPVAGHTDPGLDSALEDTPMLDPPSPPPDSWTPPPDQAIKRPDAAMPRKPRPTKKQGKRPPLPRPDATMRRPPAFKDEDPSDKEKEVIF